MALFQSYAVIYPAIGAAIHEVLFVFYSYPNDDTETATFDRTVLIPVHSLDSRSYVLASHKRVPVHMDLPTAETGVSSVGNTNRLRRSKVARASQ